MSDDERETLRRIAADYDAQRWQAEDDMREYNRRLSDLLRDKVRLQEDLHAGRVTMPEFERQVKIIDEQIGALRARESDL